MAEAPKSNTAPGIAARSGVWSLVVKRTRQFQKLVRLLPSRSYRRGLRFGIGASIEHEKLMKSIAIHTLVDVGANVGQFSLLIRALHPDAVIHAFEPLSRPAAAFTSLFRGDPRTNLHRCAIGAHVADCTPMYVARDDDSSSLLPVTDDQVRYAAGSRTIGIEQVQVRRLDVVLSRTDIVRPALLKLDVQGYELQALLGCGSVLAAMDFVYVELSFRPLYQGQALADEVIKYLFNSGFMLAAVNSPTFNEAGHCMQADFLFSRRSDPDQESGRVDPTVRLDSTQVGLARHWSPRPNC